MNVLTRYIFRQFFKSTLMMIMALAAIFMVFDLLANAGDITQNSKNIFVTLGWYMGLRLPSILVLIIPISVLLGCMITMHKMVKSHEMVIIGGAGLPIYKIAYILIIGALFFAIIQFSISDFSASAANARLRLWDESDYYGHPPDAPQSNKILWAADGSYILHYERNSPDGKILYTPLLIERDDTGIIRETYRANRALYNDENQWILTGVKGQSLSTAGDMAIPLTLKPDDFSVAAERYEEARFIDLWRILFHAQKSDLREPLDVYYLWFQRKLAQPLSAIIMVILSVPIGLFMARSYNSMLLNFTFIITGFLFFISERLLLSMGESYTLPSFLAVWSPHLVFGLMGIWFMVYKQE